MTNDNANTFQELAEAHQKIERLKTELKQARTERDAFAREFGDGNLVLAITNCTAATRELANAEVENARLAAELAECRQWIDATVANCSVFSDPPSPLRKADEQLARLRAVM